MHRRLLIRPGAIGDVILSLPALEALRSEYTEIWAPRTVVSLVRCANRTEVIACTGIDSFGLPGVPPAPGVAQRLARFDSIVSWYGSNREEFREALNVCGARCVRFFPALPPRDCAQHATDFFLAQASGMGSGCTPPIATLRGLSPVAHGSVVIHPFSGSPKKNWPLDRFHTLADALGGTRVRWCCEPGCGLKGAVQIQDLWELARWLAGASLYIGNDSGITHLAAAAGAPVLALFGPTNPVVWAPRGERVRVVAAPMGELPELDVDVVVAAAREMLR